MKTTIVQKLITLPPAPRGFHLMTNHIEDQLPELAQFTAGTLHLFIQHTSASLTINENADPTVRTDLEAQFSEMVPENQPFYQHTCEGPDDMPAHIKSTMIGSSVSIPVTHGRMNLGQWQGVYLCEHRNRAGSRRVVATISGAIDV